MIAIHQKSQNVSILLKVTNEFRYRVPAWPVLPEVQGEEPDWHPPVLRHQQLQGALDVPQGRT